MNSPNENEDNIAEGLDDSVDRNGIERSTPGQFKGFIKDRAFLLFLLFLVVYNITLETSFSRDCMPNMYLPVAMIKHGSISLSFFPELYAAGRPYFLVPFNSGLHSIFGIGAPLFALPFYLPLLLFKNPPSFTTLIYLSKFVAACYVALSAAVLFAAMRRVTRERWALLITLIYGFATAAFCTSSQALWQHAPSQFLLSLTVYFLVRGEENPRFAALAALPLSFSVLVRTTNLVFIIPVLFYIIWRKRPQLPGFILMLLPGAIITAWYNQVAYGAFYRFPLTAPKYLLPASEFSAYNEFGGFWKTPFLTGFGGNLISPSRGLFITSPILLVAIFGVAVLIWKRKDVEKSLFSLGICFFIAFLAQLLLISKKTDWTGGLSFGNRLLLDTLPFLVFLLIPSLEYYGRLGKTVGKAFAKAAFIVLLCLSLLVQIEGIISYDRGSWDLQGPLEQLAWNAKDNQFFFYLKRPRPVVPPLIKQVTGEPARLSSVQIDILNGLLYLHFHLTELAILQWYIMEPVSGEKVYLFEFYGSKGGNDFMVTSEDLSVAENLLGPEFLKNLISSSPSYEVVVIDPLTGVNKAYLIE